MLAPTSHELSRRTIGPRASTLMEILATSDRGAILMQLFQPFAHDEEVASSIFKIHPFSSEMKPMRLLCYSITVPYQRVVRQTRHFNVWRRK